MSRISKSAVDAEYLAEIGKNAFPAVREPCSTCRETGNGPETVAGLKESCRDCRGHTFIIREMTAREEHFWIIHLLNERTSNPVDLNEL